MNKRQFLEDIPLVVDLDGTLIVSDLLVQSAMIFIRTYPLKSFMLGFWLLSGKANLKQQLAELIQIDIANLPYDQRVISLINEHKTKGKQIVLATASHRIYAQQIASQLKLFDQVLATEGKRNLSKENKARVLVEKFGKKGFDYIGNSLDDLPVWAVARYAYIANAGKTVIAKAKQIADVKQIF